MPRSFTRLARAATRRAAAPACLLLLAAALLGCARSFEYSAFRSAKDVQPTSVLASRQALREPVASAQVVTVEAAPEPRRRAFQLASGVVTGNLFGGAKQAAQVAQAVPAAVPAEQEKLVVEAWIRLQADDVARAAAAVVARVEADGGRVVSSNIDGSDKAASSAALELRVPPEKTAAFASWLPSLGVIESRRTLASDVGKIMFDQALELQNLELTMSRLQKLAEKDVPIKELLEIEKEMTRVRGEIERVKGEQRWLADRVALATVTVTIVREGGPIDPLPDARVFPGPRLALLSLFDPEGRPKTRIGGGVTLHVSRYFTLDFDLFPRKDGESRVALATVGSALYSSFLGGGRRRFANPYLGLRAGYGYLSSDGCWVAAGELGLELFKHRYLLVEASVRAIAFLRANTEGALHATFGAAVPF
jgi:Domain of unknown function (DUF4349)